LEHHLLSFIALVPIAGASAVIVADRLMPGRRRALHAIAAVTTFAAFALSVPVWRGFAVRGAQWQFTDRWLAVPSVGAGVVVGIDGLGVLLVLLTTLIACLAVLASWANVPARPGRYFAALLLLEAGMLGVYMSLDLALFTISWTVAATSMCIAITAADGGSFSARRTALVVLVPAVLLLAGVAILFVQGRGLTGAPTFDLRMFQNLSLPGGAQRWAFVLFFAGFVTSIAGVFQWWLSRGGASERSGAVPLLLTAVFLKMATFGFLRLTLPLLPDATRQFAPAVLGISAIAMILAAVAAFAQASWTRVLAYASISHLCLVMLGAFALTPAGLTGSAIYQVNHGLAIAALFLVAAVVTDRGHSASIADYGGLLNAMPLVATCWLFLTLSLVGVPKLSGFVGTELIVKGLWPITKVWTILGVGGQALAAIALLWLFSRMMLGELRGPGGDVLKDLRVQEAIVVLPLVALVGWAGFKPATFLATVETSVARVVLRVSPQYGPEVADCLSQPPPAPDPALPAGMVLMAPCSDASGKEGSGNKEEGPKP
jgi:NADH-quinone oxidoreductase subunit M